MTLESVNTGATGEPIVVDTIDGKNVQAAKILLGAANTDGGFLSPANPMPIGAPPSLPLPPGAATNAKLDELIASIATRAAEATLASILARLPLPITTVPENDASAPPYRLVGQDVWNCSFSNVGTVIAPELTTPIQGTGVSFAQASGTLTITAGTTANAEFLTRSVRTWEGAMRARLSSVTGARSANNNFTWMLADLVGEGLAYNVVSATTVDVTMPAHGFTAANVGQRMFLGGITTLTGSAPCIPGRYAIASIPDVNTIRFTVSGWASSGTGTLTLFGHSYARVAFEGATATTTTYGTGRRGWTGTADTAAASNLTTASPGAIHTIELTGREAFFFDHLRASATSPTITTRASRYEDLPDDNLPLYLWIWSYNGTTGPSSTTWAISFASVEKFANLPVYLQGQRANGTVNPIAVTINGAVDTEFATAAALADGAANPTTGTAGSAALQFNGTTWDRARGNTAVTAEVSSAKVASGNSAAVTNHSARGAVFFINVSAVSGTTPTLAVRVQMQDPVGSGWVDIPGAVTASITGVSLVALAVYPGATVAANAAVSYPLPRNYRLAWTIGGTSPSFTFSVGAQYIL